ncbi:DAK2 domain-containing protein [Ktedonosporobacter rubrisoli]|uniref:DAK2 domain-containing protein n=1 Tax=Ktedonosporobacter rubrisoli TaxID=2509675 RepID=A0A4P6JXM8_KTERU|nr:DAK2 domain-containing protein [Ktedonosporobacter rubrisoli]QBD79776.1 DAK2 domain-containing protein [Ktedonosporobacter rubrisoli]
MQEQLPRTRRLRPRRISIFDGQDLRKAILAGAAWLEENREMINALNVFPVPDGDTGSNMSATLKSAIKNILTNEETSAGAIAARVAHDALMGARGNSGVILSQTLRGLAQGLGNKPTFAAQDLAVAFQEAERLAYRAVIKPVEGTILTVVRETAVAATSSAQRGDDLVAQWQEIVVAARQAVARTPEMLPLLKQAGVVDAGGQGFCTFLEGIWRYIRGEGETDQILSTPPLPAAEPSHTKKGRVSVEEEFGYEVVFLLRGQNLDVAGIRQAIIDMGGVSTVVAGDEKMLKVHTHTLTPGKILDYGVSLGSLLDINIENLQEQSLTYAAESAAEHAAEPEEPEAVAHIATVSVVSGAGFEKVFQGLGVSALVSGGQTMNPSIEELLDAVEQVQARQIIILPNNSNVILSAQQVSTLTQKEIYVVPSKTLPQGIAALLSFNFEADFATNCKTMTEAMANVQTAEITIAVRSVQIDTMQVREGDYIGVINGNLAVAGSRAEQVIHDTLQRMNIDNYEIVTLYYGQHITNEQAQETAQKIKQKHSHLEIEVVDGGQPYYAYILSAE